MDILLEDNLLNANEFVRVLKADVRKALAEHEGKKLGLFIYSPFASDGVIYTVFALNPDNDHYKEIINKDNPYDLPSLIAGKGNIEEEKDHTHMLLKEHYFSPEPVPQSFGDEHNNEIALVYKFEYSPRKLTRKEKKDLRAKVQRKSKEKQTKWVKPEKTGKKKQVGIIFYQYDKSGIQSAVNESLRTMDLEEYTFINMLYDVKNNKKYQGSNWNSSIPDRARATFGEPGFRGDHVFNKKDSVVKCIVVFKNTGERDFWLNGINLRKTSSPYNISVGVVVQVPKEDLNFPISGLDSKGAIITDDSYTFKDLPKISLDEYKKFIEKELKKLNSENPTSPYRVSYLHTSLIDSKVGKEQNEVYPVSHLYKSHIYNQVNKYHNIRYDKRTKTFYIFVISNDKPQLW